jgi:large subunit ribosomal protein L34e
MPTGKHKSRTFRRVFKRTPSGKSKLFYLKRKPKKAHCANCGKVLAGVPRERPYKMKKLSKTQKRPQRPFGGNLCSKCSRLLILEKARQGA